MNDLLLSAARPDTAKTRKGEQTRSRILDKALELFLERGYEQTTMRDLAGEAGVSLGSAYYYFESKEHLIQAFYGQTHRAHVEACSGILERETDLGARLGGILRERITTLLPYHRFAGVLFRTAADPKSPLNPFSEASRPVRAESTALFAEVLRGARRKIHPQLAARLPDLLWIYHMGIILFWIHDDSPGCRRSYRLAESTSKVVVRLITLVGRAPFRPLLRLVLEALENLGEDLEGDLSDSANTSV